MGDFPVWAVRDMDEPERVAFLRWAMGLAAGDTTHDALLRAALAESARWYPTMSEYAQRSRALEALQAQFRA